MTYKKGNGESVTWINAILSYDGDDCVKWPFSRNGNGYGNFGYLGKVRYAHRYICEQVSGPPPSSKHHAAHSCGNGRNGCVNPKHIFWKTQRENEEDKKRHGTVGRGHGSRTKLTLQQVFEIRANKGIIGQLKLAMKLGLPESTIRYWQTVTHDPAPPGQSKSSIQRRG